MIHVDGKVFMIEINLAIQRAPLDEVLCSLNSLDDFLDVSDELNRGDCLQILSTIPEDWISLVESLSSNNW